jgi:molybdate transport system substrate-binding protein
MNWYKQKKGYKMHLSKKLVLTGIIGILLAALALTGCNGATATTTTTAAPVQTTTTTAAATTPPAVTTTTAAPPKTTEPPAIELNVSAAASMTDALKAVNDLYMQKNKNVTIVANFASSGTLQKQIEQGAPADVFISAGAKQVQSLQDGGLLLDETRTNLLTNKVVLVVPKDSTLTIASFTDLTKVEVTKIAIGDPASVPAGTYGKQELDDLGIYTEIESKLILCTDVKQVLSYVEAGNVDAGIVYATDAALSTSVKIAADASDAVNAKIVYPAAIIKATKLAEAAQAYLAFLAGPEAKAIFEQYGFFVVQK